MRSWLLLDAFGPPASTAPPGALPYGVGPAAILGVRPNTVLVATHARHKEAVAAALPSLTALAEGLGLTVETKVEIVPEEELDEAFERMVRILREAREEGEVVLDITPARKSVARLAMRAAEVEEIPHVFYLYLKDITHCRSSNEAIHTSSWVKGRQSESTLSGHLF